MLRQQVDHGDDKPYLSLADFVAQQGDHIGGFAVTAGLGADELSERFAAEHDDYRSIMAKALADRLAEAFAEYLHEKVRRDWYETGPKQSREELIGEKYRGIRPAYGYPACPDHSEKFKLFDLLDARSIGMELTESGAMTPTAAVAGLYFAHPKSKYFMVGKVGKDQVAQANPGVRRRHSECRSMMVARSGHATTPGEGPHAAAKTGHRGINCDSRT